MVSGQSKQAGTKNQEWADTDTCKQYQRVLIQGRATLCTHQVYVSTRTRDIGDGIWR